MTKKIIYVVSPEEGCSDYMCDFDNTMAMDTIESIVYWDELSRSDAKDKELRRMVARLIVKRTEKMVPSASIAPYNIVGILTARFSEDIPSITSFTNTHFPWASNLPIFTRSDITAHMEPAIFKTNTFKFWKTSHRLHRSRCGLLDDDPGVAHTVAKALGRTVTEIENVPISKQD